MTPAPLLVPVLDLLDGVVVQAVRGQRERYRPVQSGLADGADPVVVACALLRVTRGQSLYMADLDAILGRGNNAATIRKLRETGCDPWVDAGIADAAGARLLLSAGAGRVVVGTECLEQLDALAGIISAAGRERVVVSLDTKGGRVLSRSPKLAGLPSLTGLAELAGMGCDRFILLTLDAVGTGQGPDWNLLEPARRTFPDATLFAGGGVRSMEDVCRAAALGLDGMLVSTALHRGWITAQNIKDAVPTGGDV